jgi:hypothetical protein
MQQRQQHSDRPNLNVAQVAGGALAAVTSAVVASRFGLGGTLIGAALASVVSTTGAALYSHAFRRTGSTVRRVIEEPPSVTRKLPRFENLTRRRSGGSDGSGEEDPPARQPIQRAQAAPRTPPPGAWRKTGAPAAPRPRRLPVWAVPVIATVVVFLIALAAVTGIEGVLGRPLSSVTGGSAPSSGTTLGGVSGSGGGSQPATTPETQPGNTTAPSQEPTTEPSAEPGTQQPGAKPTAGSEPASPAPSEAPVSPPPQPSAGTQQSSP